ncbi:hypothetical protein [Xenorhabdus sp. TH1]|uniref:hypothetical protein n=1 Tax=Xenorhabdus sp. TH1 TaxID=3130166 RepID=UPI0030CDE8E0
MQQANNIWLITAIVMAAHPRIGRGFTADFANKYGFKQEIVSFSIIISLLIALVTIPTILQLLPA